MAKPFGDSFCQHFLPVISNGGLCRPSQQFTRHFKLFTANEKVFGRCYFKCETQLPLQRLPRALCSHSSLRVSPQNASPSLGDTTYSSPRLSRGGHWPPPPPSHLSSPFSMSPPQEVEENAPKGFKTQPRGAARLKRKRFQQHETAPPALAQGDRRQRRLRLLSPSQLPQTSVLTPGPCPPRVCLQKTP